MIPDYMDRKHDYSFAQDRQLQNKLLAADDIFDQSNLTLSVLSASRLKNGEVTGWYQDDKVVVRKSENDVLSKPRISVGTREGLLSRDRSKRDLNESSFAFYHYPESHRYIEQYRRDHTCSDSTNSATTRNEFLELQRFYAYRSQTGSLYTHPTTVGYMPSSQTQSQTAIRRENTNFVNYRTSDPSLRSASRYKLSPSLNVRNEPEFIKESDQTESGGPLQVGANTGYSSKMAIHAVSKTPVHKVPAKVTVPANHSMISPGLNKTIRTGRRTGYHGRDGTITTGSTDERLPGSQKYTVLSSPKTSTVAAWENGVGAMRTLDTLACVARPGDKAEDQTTVSCSPLPELVRTPRGQDNRAEAPDTAAGTRGESESEAVHGERLTSTSLPMDTALKVTACVPPDCSSSALKAKPRLEASCTYHVFPGEEMMAEPPSLFTTALLWKPAKSTLDRHTFPSPHLLSFDPGLGHAPFKNSGLPQGPGKGPDKEQMVKEFTNDLKPFNLSMATPDLPWADLVQQRGLRGSGTKPDLPPSFELQGVSKTPGLDLQGVAKSGRPATQRESRVRKGRGRLRHLEGDRKSQSAHSLSTDTENSSSRSQRLKPQAEREGEDRVGGTEGGTAQQPAVPYFKFWNSSLQPRLKGDHGGHATPHNGDLNLRRIAELMLNNEELPAGELQELIQRRADHQAPSAGSSKAPSPSIASGRSGLPTACEGERTCPYQAPQGDPWTQGDGLTGPHPQDHSQGRPAPRGISHRDHLPPPATRSAGECPPSRNSQRPREIPHHAPQLADQREEEVSRSVHARYQGGSSQPKETRRPAGSGPRPSCSGSNAGSDCLPPSATTRGKSGTPSMQAAVRAETQFRTNSGCMTRSSAVSHVHQTRSRSRDGSPARERSGSGRDKARQRAGASGSSLGRAGSARTPSVRQMEVGRWVLTDGASHPLSVLSVRVASASRADSTGGQSLSLAERRENLTLAPTRQGLGMGPFGHDRLMATSGLTFDLTTNVTPDLTPDPTSDLNPNLTPCFPGQDAGEACTVAMQNRDMCVSTKDRHHGDGSEDTVESMHHCSTVEDKHHCANEEDIRQCASVEGSSSAESVDSSLEVIVSCHDNIDSQQDDGVQEDGLQDDSVRRDLVALDSVHSSAHHGQHDTHPDQHHADQANSTLSKPSSQQATYTDRDVENSHSIFRETSTQGSIRPELRHTEQRNRIKERSTQDAALPDQAERGEGGSDTQEGDNIVKERDTAAGRRGLRHCQKRTEDMTEEEGQWGWQSVHTDHRENPAHGMSDREDVRADQGTSNDSASSSSCKKHLDGEGSMGSEQDRRQHGHRAHSAQLVSALDSRQVERSVLDTRHREMAIAPDTRHREMTIAPDNRQGEMTIAPDTRQGEMTIAPDSRQEEVVVITVDRRPRQQLAATLRTPMGGRRHTLRASGQGSSGVTHHSPHNSQGNSSPLWIQGKAGGETSSRTPSGRGNRETSTSQNITPSGRGNRETSTSQNITPSGRGNRETSTSQSITPSGRGDTETSTSQKRTPSGRGDRESIPEKCSLPEEPGAPTSRGDSALQRAVSELVRTSRLPLPSPRKGVPLPRPQHSAWLLYRPDSLDMLVRGTECSQRPITSPYLAPNPSLSRPPPRSAATTTSAASRNGPAPRLSRQTISLLHGRQGVRVFQPTAPSARSEVVARSEVRPQIAARRTNGENDGHEALG